MAVFNIPVDANLPWYDFRVTLSGVAYILEMRFNKRMQRWILSILDVARNPILTGIPVLINRALTSQYSTLAIPPGVLYATDNSGNGLQPTLASFLSDHSILYYDNNP